MYLFSKLWLKLLFILPTFILFFFYTIYPLFKIIITSFKMETFYEDLGFVGFSNWNTIFHDEIFHKVLWNTLIVVVGEVILLLPLGMLLGFLLHSSFKGNTTVKVATFVPYILSGVMVGIIWTYILDPGVGILNAGLIKMGLGKYAYAWIGGQHLTPYSVVIVETWKTVGFYGVLFLTGLKMMPKDPFEASVIDGASRFQQIIYITIPLLKETIKICFVFIIIGAFNSYQTVAILTNGGPNNQSNLITTYLYKKSFLEHDFGQGAVLATFLFVCVMSISVIALAYSRKRVEE